MLKYRKSNKLAQRILDQDIDAITYFEAEQGFYVTIYNGNFSINRIRWTLAHEIGHIVLGHFEFDETALLRGGLDGKKYSILEIEAHTFAAELLAPTFIINNLGKLKADLIKKICIISDEAASKRAKTLSKFKYSEKQSDIRQQFEYKFAPFLKRIPMCSNINFLPVMLNYQKYPEVNLLKKKNLYVRTDDNGRFLECPQCGNTYFSAGAKFCKMCGLYLYNFCKYEDNSDSFRDYCGAPASGDARYCELCGSETFLLANGLLETWKEILESGQQIAAGVVSENENGNSENDLEGINLDDLPF
jgi:hypothetical protein